MYSACKHAPYIERYVIFESTDEKFQMLVAEFDFIFTQLQDNCWKKNISKYIQIVKEWNELKGFNDIDENPSFIQDIQDTIAAFSLISGVHDETFPSLKQKDLEHLNTFLLKHQHNEIKIFRE